MFFSNYVPVHSEHEQNTEIGNTMSYAEIRPRMLAIIRKKKIKRLQGITNEAANH